MRGGHATTGEPMPPRPHLSFEIGGSVILVGKDLQFVGVAGADRIRFVIRNDVLKRLSGAAAELTQQQKFKLYDRNRAMFQDVARRLYERAAGEAKTFKISAEDL